MITPEEFKADVRVWAEEIGVEPREIHIRKMKRKWASCSSRGRLTFDTSLLDETNEVRSRTILHELLHLKYPNHGRLFNILLNIYLKRKAEEYMNDQDATAE
jgi:predicted metal-dependent hydrolase